MELLQTPRTRKSLPLSEGDLRELEQVRTSGARRAALSRLARVELSDKPSEAGLLHAIFEAGMRAVRELAEEEGYAQIAQENSAQSRQAVARRRRPDWASE